MTTTHGFELVRDEQIDELKTRARLYRHMKTGAELLSLENDDENKCFGVTFRTPPSDSTGIAHILEHVVLAGSRNYPAKDPFFTLVKSSVYTFLNAMTYPDKTTYPVASTNAQDFYNLVDVYLDAVFFPLIKAETLKQEGWHYELESANGEMTFKGVVYNEMKGAYSSPEGLLYRYSQRSLFPDTTYGQDSGGDPTVIPDLTYEQFRHFHQTLYHPSNARLFFYGDDPADERLRRLDAVLSQFDRIEPSSQIGLQSAFDAPRSYEHVYSSDDDSGRKAFVTINWMLGEERDIKTTLALDILSYILLGNAGAPLRKALIDSGLGEDVIGGGFNDGLRQHTFSVGMKGMAAEKAEELEGLILATLGKLADEGLDVDAVAAALNTVEFSLRENNTGSFPRGLSLMLRTLGSWLYDGDPYESLRYEAPLATIRAAFENGERIFEDLIGTMLLQNSHRTRVVLRPDPEKAARDAAEEKARLDAARASMTPEQIEAIVADTHALRAMQEAPDDPEVIARIPTLRIADLERHGKTIPTEQEEQHGAPLLTHDLFTNGIVYLDLAFDLRSVPTNLLPYVPLFARALTEMGTSREDFVRLIQRIGRETGGIGASAFASTHLQHNEALGRLVVRGKGTLAQTTALLDLLRDILLEGRLDDRERFRQIVTRARAGRESSLVPSGNAYARQRLAARYSPAEWADEQMTGIDSLFFLRKLEKRINDDWDGVQADLAAVRAALINRRGLVANLTLDAAGQQEVRPALAEFIAALPDTTVAPVDWRTAATGAGEGLTIPAQVNYVAKAVNLHDLGIKPNGTAAVVMRHVRVDYLLEKIRIQGGAYGAGGNYDRSTGIFSCTSYRDPNLLRTIDVYDGLAKYLRSVELDQLTIERAVIGTIGDIDRYQLPDARGYTAMIRYLTGVSDEYREQIRAEILGTGEADFRALAEAAEALREQGDVAVVGSPEAITQANRERPDLLTPVKVL